MRPEPPLAVLLELTHRCPMRCAYCSNPLALEPASRELDTATWTRVIGEAADAGALQVHFSGGEPCARRDLEALVAAAEAAGLYGNLITSGVTLDRARIGRLKDAGLRHVQVSFQDTDPTGADRVGGLAGAHAKKLTTARQVVEAGLALTVNAVIQRGNIDRVDDFIDLALELGATRLEIANVQYYGWALANRAALLPARDQLMAMDAALRARLPGLRGRLVVDTVLPDYHARRPKACMGGWGRRFLNVTPSGRVLPCHAAETLPGLTFPTVFDGSLGALWEEAEAFRRFRGTDWMPEPCRSCDRREIDWGGCRCQALALAGDAAQADPVCELSPAHAAVTAIVATEAGTAVVPFRYRSFSASS